VTEFKPFEPEGLSDAERWRALAVGLNSIHSCVDGFRAEQAKRDAEAARKRHQTNSVVIGLQGSMNAVVTDVGELKVRQGVTDSQVTSLNKALGIAKTEPGEKRPKVRGVIGWNGWTMLGASGGLVVIYRIVVPLLEPVFHAINHAILAVH
jgi:hypothetical protein